MVKWDTFCDNWFLIKKKAKLNINNVVTFIIDKSYPQIKIVTISYRTYQATKMANDGSNIEYNKWNISHRHRKQQSRRWCRNARKRRITTIIGKQRSTTTKRKATTSLANKGDWHDDEESHGSSTNINNIYNRGSGGTDNYGRVRWKNPMHPW